MQQVDSRVENKQRLPIFTQSGKVENQAHSIPYVDLAVDAAAITYCCERDRARLVMILQDKRVGAVSGRFKKVQTVAEPPGCHPSARPQQPAPSNQGHENQLATQP
jgi:hypothetical protein